MILSYFFLVVYSDFRLSSATDTFWQNRLLYLRFDMVIEEKSFFVVVVVAIRKTQHRRKICRLIYDEIIKTKMDWKRKSIDEEEIIFFKREKKTTEQNWTEPQKKTSNRKEKSTKTAELKFARLPHRTTLRENFSLIWLIFDVRTR